MLQASFFPGTFTLCTWKLYLGRFWGLHKFVWAFQMCGSWREQTLLSWLLLAWELWMWVLWAHTAVIGHEAPHRSSSVCMLCCPAVHMKCSTSETVDLMQTWLCSQAHSFMGELHIYSYVSICIWIMLLLFLCVAAAAYIHSFFYPWNPLQTYGISTFLVCTQIYTLLQRTEPLLVLPLLSISPSLLITSPCNKTGFPWDTLRQFQFAQEGDMAVFFLSSGVLGLGNSAAYHALVLTCVGSLH